MLETLFDAQFYLENNQDVNDAGVDPLQHYLAFGFEEGRDPHPLFDSSFYLNQRLDVRDVGAEPFGHYLDFGFKEDTVDGSGGTQSDPNLFFDSAAYLAANGDVAAAGANPLLHYAQFGEQEILDGVRAPLADFNPVFYAEQNPDVADAVDAGTFDTFLEHFLRFGRDEGRLPRPNEAETFELSDIEQTDPSVTLSLVAEPGTQTITVVDGGDDGEATISARQDAIDALNLRGDASVRIDLTDQFEQLEQIDINGDGTIEVGTEEFNVRPKVDVQFFDIIDAHPRDGALLDPTDIENGFAGNIIFDGTGFAGDGSSTDGNIVLGGAGDDVVLGGIGNDFFSGGGGQNVLSGGRNADFFYQELSTLDLFFTGESEIKGGTTGDEPGQDFDWLLLEASDDQELVTVNLNTNVSDTSGTPGSVVTENGGPGQQFFGGSAAFLEDIENVNASGTFYGFLDITEGVGFADETIVSITTDDEPGQDTGSGNRFDAVLQINFTIDGETLEADEDVIVADGLSEDADEALDQIVERLDDFFAAQSGGDFDEFSNLDAREGVRDGRPALEIIDDEGRFVGISVRGEAIVDGINVFEFNVARDAIFQEEQILPDLFFGDFRDFSDEDAAVPRIPRLSPGVTAQTEIIGTESETNVLIGGYDNDRIYGLSGNDLLFGGDLEFLLTHQNNVNLFDSDGTISVNAQDGVADDGRDSLYGGAGDDNLVLELDGGEVSGDEGDDTLWLTTFTPGRTGDVSLSTDGSIEQRFILTSLLGVNQDILGTQEAVPEAAALDALTEDSAIRLDLGYVAFDGYGADREGTADQTLYESGFAATTITSVENINASGLGGIDYLAAGANDPELNFENQQNFRATNSDLVLRGQDNDLVNDLVLLSNGFDGVGSVSSPFDITDPSSDTTDARVTNADFTADFVSVLTEDDLDTAALEAYDEEFDNILIGGFGDDTIEGRGGTDRLSGREGDDTFLFTLGLNDFNNAGSGEDFQAGDENPSNAIAGDGINFINRDLDLVDQDGEPGRDNVFSPNQSEDGDRIGQDFRSEVGDILADDTLSVIQLTGDFADNLRWDLVEAIVIVREDGANLTAGADYFGEQLENDPSTSEEVAAALNQFFDDLATDPDEDIAALAGAVRAEATDDITVTIAGDPGDFAFAGAQVQQGEPEEGLDGGFLVDNEPQVIVEEGEDDEIVFLSYQNREDNELTDDESVGLGRDSYAEDLVYSFRDGTTELVEDQGYRITFAELKDFDEISVTINGWTFTETVTIDDVTGPEGNVVSQTTVEAVQDLVDQINAKIAADPHTQLGLLVTTDAVPVDVDGDGVPDSDGASFTISEAGFLDATDEDVYIEVPTVTVDNVSGGNQPLYAVEDLSQTRVSLTNFDGAPDARGLNIGRDHLEQRGEGEGDVPDFSDRYITFEGDTDGNDVGINRAILQTADPESSETLQGIDVAIFDSAGNELTITPSTTGTFIDSHQAQRDFSFADSPDIPDTGIFIRAAQPGDNNEDVGQPIVAGYVAKHGDDLLIGSDNVDEIAAGTGDDRVQGSFSNGTGDDQIDGGVNIVINTATGQILFEDGDLLQEADAGVGQALVRFEDRLIFDERDFLEDTRDPGDITYRVTLGSNAVAEDFSLDGTVDVIDKPSDSVIATTDFTNFEIVRLLTKAGMEVLDVTDFSDASDGGVFYDNTGFQGFVSGSVDDDIGSGNILGIETVIGGDGADVFLGGAVAESFTGGDNTDILDGGDGDDTLSGNDGDDDLAGGDGDDELSGGSDSSVDEDEADANPLGDESGDTLTGGLGADTMDGGAGNDVYVYETFDDSGVADENFGAFDEGDTVDTTELDILSFNDDDENEEFDVIDLTQLDGPQVADISQGSWGGNAFTFGDDAEDDDAFITVTDAAGVVEMQFVVLNAFNDPAGADDISESDFLGITPPNAVTVTGTVVDDTLNEGDTAQIILDPDVAPSSNIVIGIDIVFDTASEDDLENIAMSVTLPADSADPVTVDIADVVADAVEEEAETFSVEIDTGRGNTTLVPDSFDFTINSEVVVDPLVTDVAADPTAVNETDNNVVTFTIDSENTAGGETVDLTFNSVTGVFNDDDVEGTLPATVTLDANGDATVTLTLAADAETEGEEVFTLSAAIGAQTPVTSAEVTVADTSTGPVDIAVDGLGNPTANEVVTLDDDLASGAFNLIDTNALANSVLVNGFGEDDQITVEGYAEGEIAFQEDADSSLITLNDGSTVSQIDLAGVSVGFISTVDEFNALPGLGDIVIA